MYSINKDVNPFLLWQVEVATKTLTSLSRGKRSSKGFSSALILPSAILAVSVMML
jgi:hypothetical protein